jgi:flavin-dependent dehydrogenase
MDEYQVIIIGSGPAGASCGKALKDEGIEALIVEKKKLPRHKVCSGLVLGQAQLLVKEYFGDVIPDEVLCSPGILNASNSVAWDRRKGFIPVTIEIPKDGQTFPGEYLNLWRNKFDYWLLKKAGVEFRENCTFRGFSEDNDRIKVRLSEKGRQDKDVYCSYLVVADGGGSNVRRLLDPSGAGGKPVTGSVYQAYYRTEDMGSLDAEHLYALFEPEFGGNFPTGVHRKDELLTLCLTDFEHRNLKKCMESLKTFLAEQFGVMLGGMERHEGCIVRMEPPILGRDRVLLTGAAAGLVYLNGEGIAPAIDSGYRAGKAICRGIKERKSAFEIYKTEARGILNHMQACFAYQAQFMAKMTE